MANFVKVYQVKAWRQTQTGFQLQPFFFPKHQRQLRMRVHMKAASGKAAIGKMTQKLPQKFNPISLPDRAQVTEWFGLDTIHRDVPSKTTITKSPKAETINKNVTTGYSKENLILQIRKHQSARASMGVCGLVRQLAVLYIYIYKTLYMVAAILR